MAAAEDFANAGTVPPPAEEQEGKLAPGTMIADRYRIERVLGEGGMGVVYAAEHIQLRKEVALKVLHAELGTMPDLIARFEREAIATSNIDHPNIAAATDFGRLPNGSCYLALELLRGVSLRDEINGPFEPDRARSILRGIAAGIAAAHAKGVIHRDLKPENIMLIERDGKPDFPKVLDFGIAKVDSSSLSTYSTDKILTKVGTIFGTPEYMSPEQAAGDKIDARADLYSLGVIYLEMLTGKCPFEGNALALLRERILAPGPPDMSNVPDPTARVLIAKLLTRYPDDRFESGAALIAAIDELSPAARTSQLPAVTASAPIVEPSPPPAPIVETPPPIASPKSFPKWALAAIGLASALFILFGSFALVNAMASHPKPTPAATAAVSVVALPPPIPVAASVPPPADPPPTPSEADPEPSAAPKPAPKKGPIKSRPRKR